MRRFILPALAVLAGLALVAQLYRTDQKLADAIAATKVAQAEARFAIAFADTAIGIAAAHKLEARRFRQTADSAVRAAQYARARAAAVQLPAGPAPDTCAPYVAALTDIAAHNLAAAEHFEAAYWAEFKNANALAYALDTTTTALVVARGSLARLEAASGDLVAASKPSFLSRLIPEIRPGLAVGLDPRTGKYSQTAGITLSWSL